MITDLIFDLGMHNGDDTAYYLHKGYRVVAVDANPHMIDAARKRFPSELAKGQLRLEHAAVSAAKGETTFWINLQWSELSSVYRESSARLDQPLREITVPTIEPGDLFTEYGIPYYLKIDIEGNDLLCLQSLTKDDLPAFCSWEAGGVEPLFLARSLGFDVFQCIDQSTLGAIDFPPRLRTRSAEWWKRQYQSRDFGIRILRKLIGRGFFLSRWYSLRKDGAWRFPMGASGSFGPSLPSPWRSVQRTALAWLYAFHQHEAHPRKVPFPWTDFHAGQSSFLNQAN